MGEQRQGIGRRAPGFPQGVAAIHRDRAEGIGIGQQPQAPLRHTPAPRQFLDAGEGPGGSDRFGNDGMGPVLAETTDLPQPQPQRMAPVGTRFQRAVPGRMVDVDGAYLDPVLARVAHELRGGIEAHRLRIEQGAGEHRRMMALDPGRDIDQPGEGQRVALGKAVRAEALDLVIAALGEVARIAARGHARDHLVLELVDRADIAKGGHGAAQPVGFGRGEAGGGDRQLHRLFLEDRHAIGIAEQADQFVGIVRRRRGWIFDLFLAAAAAQVGMDHIPLDRARTDDRHLHGEVVERPRL